MQSTLTMDEIYTIFLKWYVQPNDEKDPKTIPLFCEKFSLSLPDVQKFSMKETFAEDLVREAKIWGKGKVPELLNMLYNKYKHSQSANDLRMFKELLELDKENKGISFNFNVLNPTDDQYRQIIARESKQYLPSTSGN